MLDTAKLIEDICHGGKQAFAFSGADEIISHLVPKLESGDVVAIMSNGGFGGIHEKLLLQLKSN
jgi:UDP-N-acetylmuramate: L-alanyl-gamma-D-glutamyl-meso-diaminopimelate ligase